jgi:Tfp pilus assembly protein FimT
MAELLVVCAVIGILSALAYPYFTTYLQSAALKAGAQELATIINGARQLAIARNVNVCMTLSGNNALYRLNASAACGGGTVFVGAMTKSDGTIALSNDIQVSGTTANVVFSNLGAAAPAGTYTVRNTTTNRTMSVVVAASGRVTIQ